MAIYRATIIIETDGTHTIEQMDVIEFDGQFWLVPEWFDNPSLGVTVPARIISLAAIPHYHLIDSSQFVVENPISRSIFEGEEDRGFVVLERPAIQFPIPPVLN
jgi:hypothetical protein